MLGVLHGDFASVLPRIVSLREGMFNRTLRLLDLDS